MSLQQTKPTDIPVGPPVRPRGILAGASPAPEGWESGGLSTNELCPTVSLEDQCITFEAENARSATRPTGVRWPAFTIEQSSGCSTLSYGDRSREAREALDSSTDYALGLALLSGAFNTDAPSLADAASLGEFPNATAALARLEGAAARGGEGQLHVIHATPSAAVYLANAGLIDESGRTPTGALLIVSAGYETVALDLRLWATGRVWAAVGSITVREDVHRGMNNREAWATRSAVVGFNSCINYSADIVIETP